MKIKQQAHKSFGAWMKAKRIEQGLSQYELARRTYCHGNSIGRWEREEGCPTLDQAETIAEVLGAKLVLEE